MNSYKEVKDTITLTKNSVNVSQGSFIQLRIRSKQNTPIRVTCDGVEYQINSGDVTPKFDGITIVYKDTTESEVFIERSTYTLDSKVDNDESFVTTKTNPLTGRIRTSIGANGITGQRSTDRAPAMVFGAGMQLSDVSIVAGAPALSIITDAAGNAALRIACNTGENTEIKIPALAGALFAGEIFVKTTASYIGGTNQVLAYLSPDATRATNCASAGFGPTYTSPLNTPVEPSQSARTYRLGKEDLSISGAITYPFVTDYVSLRFIPRAGYAPVIYLYGIGFAPRQKKGRICVTVDDGYDSWFKLGQPIFEERGIPVTLAVIPSNMDTGSGNTYIRQLRSFVNRKNAIVAHGPNISGGIGSLMTTFGDTVSRIADMTGAVKWIADQGLDTPNYEQCYVWPQGAWQATDNADSSLLDAAIAAGFTTGRAVGGTIVPGFNFDGLSTHQHLTMATIGHTFGNGTMTTAAEATNISNITAAIGNLGTWRTDAFLVFHRVQTTATADGSMSSIGIRVSDLTTIADAIATRMSAGDTDAITMPQLSTGGSVNPWQN